MDEGIVPGGGVTLINLSQQIDIDTIKLSRLEDGKSVTVDLTQILTNDTSTSLMAGASLLKKALEQPFRVILENAGLNADEWLPQVKAAKVGMGVNVNTADKLVDLKASGVVDPARVTMEAIQNAVSVAGTAMTMGALVVDVPEKKVAGGGGASPEMEF